MTVSRRAFVARLGGSVLTSALLAACTQPPASPPTSAPAAGTTAPAAQPTTPPAAAGATSAPKPTTAPAQAAPAATQAAVVDRKSTRLNSSHGSISYAV